MRILYHHRTRATDAQRVHILEIVQAFRKLGHEVEIASLVPTEGEQNVEREAEEAGWKKLLLRIPFAYELVQLGYNAIGIPLLLAKVLSWKPAFIYERYSLFNFSGVVVAKLAGIPLILEVNSPFALEQKTDQNIRAVGLALWTERLICSWASKVIVVSGPLRRIMVEIGVPAEKLVVMPNGVNPDHMRPANGEQELRKSLGLEGKVVVGFVGWFKAWHGLGFLLKSFHRSGLGNRGVALLLVGDGPALPDLLADAERLGLKGSVVFTGAVPHAEIPRYLALIDIAVQPAANEYCCPMKILEYLALGKPLIGPRQENIQELVREGVDAMLFPPSEEAGMISALESIALDAGRRASMSVAAARVIEERGFLWTRNAQRVIDLASPTYRSRSGL